MIDGIVVPTYDSLMNPLLQALHHLGGSATIEEINSRVAEICGLSDDQLQVQHVRGRGSEVDYRLAWTRTYLKAYGLIDNSSRGVWSLTVEGRKVGNVDARTVVRTVAAMQRKPRSSKPERADESPALPEPEADWREILLELILGLPPSSFERLAQRILRESGFIQVEVTGRSGDGGIDGNGILRLGGLLSFHVSFQCKRWQGTVGPATIREFRGAMMGRADKGLIITTSSFTKDAVREATRDGAAAIDLVDGEQLIDMLKDLGLGVTTRQIEEISIDKSWFEGI
jgi:restriction system protein